MVGGEKKCNIQILQVPPRKLRVRHDLDLALALLGDLDRVAEVADAVVDLDLVVQELLEGGDVEDLVRRGLGGVDDELFVLRTRASSVPPGAGLCLLVYFASLAEMAGG